MWGSCSYKIFLVKKKDCIFINIVEKMSGCPPEIEGNPENKTNDIAIVQSILQSNLS